MGAARNHHAIFAEHIKSGGGTLYHVTGDIQNGMKYETRSLSRKPDVSASFISKTYIGRVKVADVGRIDAVCQSIAAPAKQFQGAKRIDSKTPLRRCQEWTKEAIGALQSQGILGA